MFFRKDLKEILKGKWPRFPYISACPRNACRNVYRTTYRNAALYYSACAMAQAQVPPMAQVPPLYYSACAMAHSRSRGMVLRALALPGNGFFGGHGFFLGPERRSDAPTSVPTL